jgi:hypothetical protein
MSDQIKKGKTKMQRRLIENFFTKEKAGMDARLSFVSFKFGNTKR